MGRLDELIQAKYRVLQRYRKGLADITHATLLPFNGLGRSVPFRISVLVEDPKGLGHALESKGVATRRFFYPLHLQPSLTAENSVVRCKPVNSVRIFSQGLSLPSSADLTDQEIDYVCQCIQEFAFCRT